MAALFSSRGSAAIDPSDLSYIGKPKYSSYSRRNGKRHATLQVTYVEIYVQVNVEQQRIKGGKHGENCCGKGNDEQGRRSRQAAADDTAKLQQIQGRARMTVLLIKGPNNSIAFLRGTKHQNIVQIHRQRRA